MNFRARFIAILLLSGSLFSVAQTSYSHNLNIESGLSNNYIRTIFKDSHGLMWFGTDAGLDSYDGLQITTYAKRFKIPLKGAVQTISELTESNLIVGTSWGAFLYNIHKNHITPIDFGIPSIDVRSVFISSKKLIFLATERGLFTLNSTILKTKPFPLNGKSIVSLAGIIEDNSKHLWVCGNEGLFEILPDNKVIVHATIYPLGQNIHSMKQIGKVIYLGTIRGLYAYDTGSGSITPVKGTEDISILSLSSDNTGNLYIGTDNAGLLYLNTRNSLQAISANNIFNRERISTNTICALYHDNSKTLWAGTFDGGVDFSNLQTSKRFNTINFDGSTNANIRSIYIDNQGQKYVGTRDGSLLCLDAANKIKKRIGALQGKNFRSNILTTIFPFPGQPNILLIGTFGGGITLLNKKTLACSDFTSEKIFQNGSVYKFCTDKYNQLWIATLDGLYNYNPTTKSLQKFNVAATTGSNEIFTIYSDNKDKIWVGTKTGACYYSLSKKHFVQPESCKSYQFQCSSTFVDSKGNVWFCFNKGGVLELDQNQKEKRWITKEIGLPENAPSSLLQDKQGDIWIGTSKGLYKVNKNNSVHAYGFEDGLTGIGFCPESATLDASGNLWWSNDKGLVTFINDKSGINNQPPPLKFTDLFINGQRYDADTLTFVTKVSQSSYSVIIKGKSNNNLEFRVAALNYKNARRNQYSFFLEGVDKDWTKASTNPIAAYSQLAPGAYKLKIKASNNDDIWTPTPTEIQFSIKPYFYETVWFTILIWIIIGSVVLYFTRSYIARMKAGIMAQLDELKKKQTISTATLKITEQKGNEIKKNLLAYMSDEKPFLNAELRQADVATAIGYSVHELSQVLNVQLNQNFSDFVNSYRVEEVKLRMQTEDAKKYTLTAIAMQCGFSAKSSFLRAFKKATNMTPSEYFKGMKVE
ncbi:MAG: two-component regulator propeller domain-containing protein [Paludibacter sp.]|nr:two-component regulator propeller domain-containing protein [Paludibacter sp.]